MPDHLSLRSQPSGGRFPVARRTPVAIAAACLLAAGSLPAVGQADQAAAPTAKAADAPKSAEPEAAKKTVARIPDAAEKPIVTTHSITVDGRQVDYTAEAGMLPLLKEDGAPRASVFYVAYTLSPAAAAATPAHASGESTDPSRRPILFCFNGGPGASAVWLHLGGLGPRRAKVHEDGTLPAPPFEIVDNDSTALLAADLVFIDPVSTGYSRAAKDEKPEQFFGKDPDIEAIAEFIRLYTSRHKRWRSPKYLCGESYGVFRAAGVANALQNDGMFLSGLVLVSGLVDFETIRAAVCNDLPHCMFLPSFTAVAHFHGRLPPDLQADLPKALAEARAFAAGEYVTALHAGAALAADRRESIAGGVARLTGLPSAIVLKHDLRVDPGVFRKELLADKGLICGRFDGRITGRDGDPATSTPAFDPSYTAALGPLATAMNAYVREELAFESDSPYKVLAGVGPWKFEQNAYASTSRELAEALSENPHLRVLVQVGLCDLAVPGESMRHSIDHLKLAPELRGNISFAEYASGHMMYLNLPDLRKLRKDLEAFIR
jgi:carboxypeptidase C (cathepsin A)